MMRRARVLLSGVAAWPLAARAQQPTQDGTLQFPAKSGASYYPDLLGGWSYARFEAERYRGSWSKSWTCEDCGTAHDRDVNAAKNILRGGLTALAEGTSTSGLRSPAFGPGIVTLSQRAL